MKTFFDFISHSQSIIYLLITIGGWLIFLYKQSQKPEQRQNEQINEIYKMLSEIRESVSALQTDHLEGIKTTVRLLVRREFSRMCMECLANGYCTIAELDNIEMMYHEYHKKYDMNGKGDELYHRVLSLPIKDDHANYNLQHNKPKGIEIDE